MRTRDRPAHERRRRPARERDPAASMWSRRLAAERGSLPLAELEALAGARASVLLALDGARIARDEPRLLQDRPELRVQLAQRAGDAVADGARLAREAATPRGDEHVELAHLVDQLERLDQDHLRRLAAEVRVERPAVDGDVAGPWSEAHARDGLLATADGDLELGHRFLVTARASAPRASAPRADAARRRRP